MRQPTEREGHPERRRGGRRRGEEVEKRPERR